MKVWVDLANTPQVPLLVPVVERLRADGHEVAVTLRDHSQTVELGRRAWPDAPVVGGPSPDGRLAKGANIAGRALALRRFAARERPDVAFSHASYAQIVASRLARVPVVTMMDYEFQPANHLSFRLARRVIVPEAFLERPLRRAGAHARKVVRYPGFKEELYLGRRRPDAAVLVELGLDPARVLVVMRPAPEGALYHRMENERFDALLAAALAADGVQVVILPRHTEQGDRYRRDHPRAIVPEHAVDAASLLAFADATIGAGGTMTRESAILGTPTYTIFAGELAGVDRELIRRGLLHDLRDAAAPPAFVKKPATAAAGDRGAPILDVVVRTIYAAARAPAK